MSILPNKDKVIHEVIFLKSLDNSDDLLVIIFQEREGQRPFSESDKYMHQKYMYCFCV